MPNPILIEVTRGSRVESRHRGAVAVTDASGDIVFAVGDIEQPIFPRSAVKSIQALPLVESGAADAFGFGNQELALACASHSAEQAHIDLARSMLARAGLSEAVLECGGHWASGQQVLIEQARQYTDVPPAVCNNCSGKHSGFVCTASHLGISPAGYVQADHAIQKEIRGVLQALTGQLYEQSLCGTDGCSIPTYATPLRALAQGFAKMISGVGLSPLRAQAARRLTTACMSEPHFVAGSGRFCTDLMRAGNGRLFAKTGAEGVFCGAIAELGLGIALKCDDGAVRASEVMMAAVISKLLPNDDELQTVLSGFKNRPLTNWNQMPVGEIRSVTTAFS